MFSSKYLTIVVKIRAVVVTRAQGVLVRMAIIGDEDGGCRCKDPNQ